MFWQRKGSLLRLVGPALLGLALAALGGCGGGKAAVSGKVSLSDGTPVPAGTITFWASDNQSAQATLKPDGTYSLGDAPVGDVKVTVETPLATPMGPTGMGKPPPGVQGMPKEMLPPGERELGNVKVVPVPKQYMDKSTTPLTYTVTRGKQKKDFTITP
jgi:hypothetical protein